MTRADLLGWMRWHTANPPTGEALDRLTDQLKKWKKK